MLQRIKGDDGEWKKIADEIQVVIENYFSELFKASSLDGNLSSREYVARVSRK